eukprot:3907430-Amphidinium_carterae.1
MIPLVQKAWQAALPTTSMSCASGSVPLPLTAIDVPGLPLKSRIKFLHMCTLTFWHKAYPELNEDAALSRDRSASLRCFYHTTVLHASITMSVCFTGKNTS